MSDSAGFDYSPNVVDDVEMLPQVDTEPQIREHEMDDLFGHDDDHAKQVRAVPASPTTSGPESERVPSPERERRRALEYEEEDAPEIAVEVKEAHVKFPNLPVPKSSDGNCWVIRLPNFVSVDTKPFHSDTYISPDQEDESLQNDNIREKSMSVKLRVDNTLRWRWTKDEHGQDKPESNARIVRWSDGTLGLRLGKELFDITQSIDSSGSISRSTLGGSQSQPPQPSQASISTGKSEGLTYLVAQHKRSQVLQAEALITGYMALRPTGMQSETHRLLVKAVGQKHNKITKLKMVPEPTKDPELEKLEMIKQSAKKSRSRRAAQDESWSSRKKRRGVRAAHIFTDDEEDENDLYGEEDEDDPHRSSLSPKKRKAGDGEEYQADDFVVPDESDDEGGGRIKKAADEDDLDKMEAKLEKQAKKDGKKPKKEVKDESEDDQGAMDVESEEEEIKVRRVTGKRAVAKEEEEEEE